MDFHEDQQKSVDISVNYMINGEPQMRQSESQILKISHIITLLSKALK